MKRQAAFSGAAPMLKGALHCHTTRSDGKGDPAEVIALHKEHGYDVIALTDHRLYNYDNFGEDGITIIPGMEIDVRRLISGSSVGPSQPWFHDRL